MDDGYFTVWDFGENDAIYSGVKIAEVENGEGFPCVKLDSDDYPMELKIYRFNP